MRHQQFLLPICIMLLCVQSGITTDLLTNSTLENSANPEKYTDGTSVLSENFTTMASTNSHKKPVESRQPTDAKPLAVLPENTEIPESAEDDAGLVKSIEPTNAKNLVPLAVGGIALVTGLAAVLLIAGLFMYYNKRTGLVYEAAKTSDVSNYI